MAAEADASLLRHHAAVIRQAAMREVKRRRQKLGIKETLPNSTLTRLAIEWLDQHPELYAVALASPIVQNLRLAHSRRGPDPKQELLCKSQVQNGGLSRGPQHSKIERGPVEGGQQ
jgi:hypothetical protein